MATRTKRAAPENSAASSATKEACTKEAGTKDAGTKVAGKAEKVKEPAPKLEAGAAATPATLRTRELIAQVAAATGSKKPQVRGVVEATLAAMGAALAEGRALNLPPLGKAHVTRTKDRGGAEVMILKLRRTTGNAAIKAADDQAEPLADAGH